MKVKKIIICMLLILWMGLIFFFSHQPADDSDKASNGVIEKIIYTVQIISGHEFNDNELEIISNYLVFPIRKLAHFSIYFVLGILFYNLLILYKIDIQSIFKLSILFCIIYACSDEIHQLFIVGRSGSLRDVLIDALGSLLGIMLSYKQNKRRCTDDC